MASSTPDIPRTSSSSLESPSVSGSSRVNATSGKSVVQRKYSPSTATFFILQEGSSDKINAEGSTDRLLRES